jgi:hypothetical protein
MSRRREIFGGDGLSKLRRVDNGAFENTIIVQDGGNRVDIA